MGRHSKPPIRLDIVGLSQWIFDVCKQSCRTLVGTSVKSRAGFTDSLYSDVQLKLGNVPKEEVALHSRIALIAVDFERAYGRHVEIRIFEHSPNRMFDYFMRRSKKSASEKGPEFFVNGIRVYKGVPNSFSELDEAIDNAFGHSRPQ